MVEPVGSSKSLLYLSRIIMFILSIYPFIYIVVSRGISIGEDNISILKILALMSIMIYSVLRGGPQGIKKGIIRRMIRKLKIWIFRGIKISGTNDII